MKVHYGIPIMAVLVVLTAAFSLAQAQDPYLTPIQFLPGDNTIGPASGDQTEPAIAKGGNMYLAAWTDNRTDLVNNLLDDQGTFDIYAARLDANGALIDSLPIVVSESFGQQHTPLVVWNGENWLVVWVSQVPTQYYYEDSPRAVRISPQGEVLDATPIALPLRGSIINQWLMCAGSDGSNWTVIIQGSDAGDAGVKGARIGPDGTLLDPQGIVILAETYYMRFNPQIAFAQDEYLFVLKDFDDIKGLRLNPDLSWIDANPFIIAAGGSYDKNNPEVTSNGTDFLVGWEDYLQSWYSNPMVTRVDHNGQVLDPSGILLKQMSGYGNYPRLAWDGTNWIAAWSDPYDANLYAARITTGGTVLDPGGDYFPNMDVDRMTGGMSGGIQIVYSGGPYQLPQPYDVFTVNISGNMIAGPSSCISLGYPSQTNSDVAGDGSTWMAAYLSRSSLNRRVLVQPLGADGTPLTNEPVELAAGAFLSSPEVAFNGSLYLAAWRNGSSDSIWARRVLPNGTPVDASPIFIMRGYELDVAAVGDTFLVLGTYKISNIQYVFPFSVRMRGSDGAILDPTPVRQGQSFARGPKVTSFGGRWLATWARYFSHDDPHDEAMAAFINLDGTTPGEFTVSYGGYRYGPNVATGPDTALIIWHEPRISNANWNLYARRILTNGTLLDGAGFAITTAANDQRNAAIGWDGGQWVTMYDDWRAIPYFFDKRTDVYGTRIASSGQIIDPNGFAFSNDTIPEVNPAVAAADNGVSILAASIFRDQTYTAYRVGIRLMGLPPACCSIDMVPDNSPVIVPAGGSFGLNGTVGNPTTSPISTDVLVGVLYLNSFYLVGTYLNIPLNPGQSVSAHFNQNVPLYAPPGNYRYMAYCGDQQTNTACDSAFFDFTVTNAKQADGADGWALQGGWDVNANVPSEFKLVGSYPNPFNARTTITYELPIAGNVNVEVYNIMGQKVATLVNGYNKAGQHSVNWDAAKFSSGIYFYKLSAGNKVFTKRMTLLK